LGVRKSGSELVVICEGAAAGRRHGGNVARAAVIALAGATLLACTQSEVLTDQPATSNISSKAANPVAVFRPASFSSFPESYFAASTFSPVAPSSAGTSSAALAYAAPDAPTGGMSLASASSTPVLDLPVKRSVDPKNSSFGIASFYRHHTHTASGERFDETQLTAAHRTLPFGTRVRVTNLSTGRAVTVRINDRGPFIAGRIVDLSYSAADQIGMVGRGVTKVKLEVVEEAGTARQNVASAPK